MTSMNFVEQKQPIYFENNTSETNIIQLWFPVDNDRTEIAARTILPALLMKTSASFPEIDLMNKEYLRKYIISMSAGIVSIGNKLFIKFSLETPRKTIIPEVDFDECLKFFQDTILNPNIKNGVFDKFEQEKIRIQTNLKNNQKNKYDVAYNKVMKKLSPEGSLTDKIPFYPEQLDVLTSDQVLEFYNKTIKNKTPFIFLFGDKDFEKTKNQLHDLWKKDDIVPSINTDCNEFLEIKGLEEISEEGPYQESILTLVYKVSDMKEEDRLLLMILNRMLTSRATNLLMKKLRDQAKLVYNAGSTSYSHFGFLIIDCYINHTSKEEAIKQVNTMMEELKEIELISSNLYIIREQSEINLLRKLDQKYDILYDHIDKFFGIEKTLEEETELIRKMNPETILDLINRLQLDLVYFLKGVGDN